jgi:integrase/recombinase XerD
VSLLVYNGLRIDEALACDVSSLTYHRGHQALRITRKGGRASTEPLAPSCSAHCRTTSATAPTGRCSSTATGAPGWPTPPATPSSAGSPAAPASRPADRLRPHTHSRTELLGNGVPLQDVQDAMGHADPRTTRRYDRSRHNLDRHPTYQMATHIHRTTGPPPE